MSVMKMCFLLLLRIVFVRSVCVFVRRNEQVDDRGCMCHRRSTYHGTIVLVTVTVETKKLCKTTDRAQELVFVRRSCHQCKSATEIL